MKSEYYWKWVRRIQY